MELNKTAVFTNGSVGTLLLKKTLPMVFGMAAMVLFNLVDTFFVGRLGVKQLAALGFTFPVILFVGSVAIGLGIGTSTVVSKAIGRKDSHKTRELTTYSLFLSLLVVSILVFIGQITINPLFRVLGAEPELIPLIRQYMSIWYYGVIFVIVPMVGNNAIRAKGDTFTPSVIMMSAVLINGVLDYFLIFGIGIFPRLGLKGAAIATVCARAVTFLMALGVLYYRDKMLGIEGFTFRGMVDSWMKILYVGIPAASARMLVPAGIGVVIRIISLYGKEAVAAFGIAGKIEFFALSSVVALSIVCGPFVGQNWAAKLYERVRLGLRYSDRFSFFLGAGVFIFFALFGRIISSLFSSNPEVIRNTYLYLMIVPLSYGLRGVSFISNNFLNVLNHPFQAAFLIFIQLFVFYIPLSYIGSCLWGIPGIFMGIFLSYCLGGVLFYAFLNRVISILLPDSI